MPENMFPRVKLEHKTAPNNCGAPSGEQIKDMRNASVLKPVMSMQKIVRPGDIVVPGCKESAHAKYSRWNYDREKRGQRSVHNGHVDLSR